MHIYRDPLDARDTHNGATRFIMQLLYAGFRSFSPPIQTKPFQDSGIMYIDVPIETIVSSKVSSTILRGSSSENTSQQTEHISSTHPIIQQCLSSLNPSVHIKSTIHVPQQPSHFHQTKPNNTNNVLHHNPKLLPPLHPPRLRLRPPPPRLRHSAPHAPHLQHLLQSHAAHKPRSLEIQTARLNLESSRQSSRRAFELLGSVSAVCCGGGKLSSEFVMVWLG